MNKTVYKMIILALKDYRHTYITHYKHNEFLFGYISGIIESLYITGRITYYSKYMLINWIINKTEQYKKESGH